MSFIVYLRKNLVNEKCYIGQTNDFKRRERDWRCFKKAYANKHIDEDRVSYGFDVWSEEKLAEVDTQEEAWELEKKYIIEFDTKWPNGYNLEGGGVAGKQLNKETKLKIKENNKKYWFGKQRNDETKLKIKETLLNRKDKSKQVYQYTLDGELVAIWPSIMECKRNGYSNGRISDCCNGKLNQYKGFKWSFEPLNK